jgi:HEPN domain-containing protein
MKNKQTAVEWLALYIKGITSLNCDEVIEQAKEMEKQQIEDAYVECWKANMPDGYECKKSAKQYYNETYGGNK